MAYPSELSVHPDLSDPGEGHPGMISANPLSIVLQRFACARLGAICRAAILNRHTATTPMAQAFPSHLQPQHRTACCASKGAKNPCELAIVALWRIETRHDPFLWRGRHRF